MQSVSNFLRRYKLFSFALVALLVGLGLQLQSYHVAAHWVVGTVAIIEVLPLLWGMIDDVRSGTYGIDILAATAIIVSVLLHQSWAGIVVVLMLTGGESLEDYAEHRSKAELEALLKQAPQTAHVIRNKKTLDVKASEIKLGDRIIIRPGELVPVDAVILEGTGDFNEASLTGESLPLSKTVNDQILSGSVNVDGVITAKASATAHDSQFEQIIRLVRSAAGSQAPFVRLADRYSIPFSVAAFVIAGAAWVVGGHAIRFLDVIVVATPCPLILAAPIALISGMARASKQGIIVKTGSALEKLAEAKVIAFDKTGTLTQGLLVVSDITTYNKASENDVLALAAGLEQNSNHVVAQAIIDAAADKSVKPTKTRHVQELAGLGLRAQLKGGEALVGRLSLLQEHDVQLPAGFKTTRLKASAVYVAQNNVLIGVISLKDEVRADAAATIITLQKSGLKNMMLITGDNEVTAQAIAKSVDISEVYADMLPGDKLHTLEKVSQHPLVFVGDGVNDAPALSASDVGIALGARGSTAASESADIVILPDNLSLVADAYRIAKRTFSIATQSILVGIGLSLVLMLIFSTGKFPPLLGALLQEVVDVVVIFNALRAHSNKPLKSIN
jgi:heavy metal translocating P-type ATPase